MTQARNNMALMMAAAFAIGLLVALSSSADSIQIIENESFETGTLPNANNWTRSNTSEIEIKQEFPRSGSYSAYYKTTANGQYVYGSANNYFRVTWNGRYAGGGADATGGVRPGFVLSGAAYTIGKDGTGKDADQFTYRWHNEDDNSNWMTVSLSHNQGSYQTLSMSNTNPVPTTDVNDRFRPELSRDSQAGDPQEFYGDDCTITADLPTLALGPAPGTNYFPVTDAGATNEITIVVTNNGETGTILYGAYITNSSDLTSTTWSKTAWYENTDPSNVFSFVSGTNVELNVGASQTVTIRFTPPVGDMVYTGTIRIATTDPINRYGPVDEIQTTIQYEEYTLIGTSQWAAAQPAIDNDSGATASMATEATLRGTLTAGGTADIYIYWGTEDRTNDAANWENVITNGLGVSQGSFSNAISNLYYGIRYYYRCYATNSAGTNWASPTTNFVTANPGGLVITNTHATNLTQTTAALLGELDATNSVFEVTVYWSLSNNADSAAWLADGSASNAYIGWCTNVVDQLLSNDVSSLSADTTYYYAYFCTNAATNIWASPNASFTTLPTETAPTVTNGTPSSSVATNATLAGGLSSTGALSTTAYTYWGLSDGDTVKTNWGFVITNGVLTEGPFSTNVAGLWYGIRYYYRCYATNSAGDDWANWTTNFVTAGPGGLAITNTHATNVTGNAAAMLGTLDSTSSVFDVTLYWSTSNNADSAAWLADGTASSASLGWYTNVVGQLLSNYVSSLSADTTYYYTYYCTNAATEIWASPNASFTTPGPPPYVTNSAPTLTSPTNATLAGIVGSTGASPTTVYTYWGLSDGETTKTNWDFVITNGILGVGSFSTNVGGLYYGIRYYYRCYASNAGGGDWADWTTNFITAEPPGGELTNRLGILDLAANGGTNPATGSAWANGDNYRLIFVSSGSNQASSTDIADYNTFIQGLADASSLSLTNDGVTWKAVGSTATVDARDNTDSNPSEDGTGEAIFLMNGTECISTNYADFWDGHADPQDIDLDEENNVVRTTGFDSGWSGWGPVWTGTDGDGTGLDVLGNAGNISLGLANQQGGSQWTRRSTDADSSKYFLMYGLSETLTLDTTPFNVTNTYATNWTTTSADVFGTLSSTDTVFEILLYWSTNDNANRTQWLADGAASSTSLGWYTNVSSQLLSNNLTSLSIDTVYYYTYVGTNDAVTFWPLLNSSFRTAGPPDIDNGVPSSSRATNAILPGVLTWDGYSATTVHTYWGLADGGEVKTNWDFVITNGVLGMGSFSTNVGGLWYGLRYYYRCYATNAAGEDWAEWTTNFVTDMPRGNVVTGELGVLDVTANGGTNPATGSPWEVGDKYRLIFVSSTSNTATNTSIDFYNSTIQSLAAASSLNLTRYGVPWKCIGSTTNIDARDNTETNPDEDGFGEAVIMMDGVDVLATNYADLWNGNDASDDVKYDEEGNTPSTDPTGQGLYPGHGPVWTGTRPEGTALDPLGSTGVVYGLMYGDGAGHWINRGGTADSDWTCYYYGLSDKLTIGTKPLFVTNTYATNITGVTASGLGEVDFTQSVFEVFIYWSTNDNASPAAWLADGSASSASAGWYTNVVNYGVTGAMTGMLPTTTNYYRLMGTNAATSVWATVNSSFVTLAGTPPVLTNSWGTTNITTNSAVFHGYLSSTGSAAPTLWVYYGTVDGGEDLAGWQSSNQVGVASGTGVIATNIAGLSSATNYYYRFYASNDGGTDWSPVSQFLTAPWTLPFYEPFEDHYVGEVQGQRGWQVSSNGAAVVQTNVVYAGTNALQISNTDTNNGVTLSHEFVTNTYTNEVWVDVYSRVQFSTGPGTNVQSDETVVFYVNTNGNIVAYNGASPSTLTWTSVAGGTNWSRFTAGMNYSTKTYDLYLDGVQVATNYGFYDNSQTSFAYVLCVEFATNSSYLDNFNITLTTPLGGIPVINNANGATLITGSTAFLNGVLSNDSATVVIYYGTSDGTTTPGSWDSSTNLGSTVEGPFSNQVSMNADTAYYYRCYATNTYGGNWATNSSIWMAQTRTKGGWHLVSVPVDFGAGQNTLDGALGTNLAVGLYGSNSWEGDMLWYQETTNWMGYWLATNDVWRNDADTNLATRTLGPGTAFWVKRRTNGGAATAYTTFAGDKPTTSTQLVFAVSNWTVFGWPFDETTQDSDSWGFAITGATKALGSEYADRLRAEYGGIWYNLYLHTNGNWCVAGTRNKANIMLQPGKGYYYYRRGSSDLIWSAPGP